MCQFIWTDESAIKEKMEALLREKAKEVYSEKIVDYGTNPKNYGTMDIFDGYAKEPDDCAKDVEMFIRMRDGKVEEQNHCCGCIFTIAACNAAAEMSRVKLSPNVLQLTRALFHSLRRFARRSCSLRSSRGSCFSTALKDYILKNKS